MESSNARCKGGEVEGRSANRSDQQGKSRVILDGKREGKRRDGKQDESGCNSTEALSQ